MNKSIAILLVLVGAVSPAAHAGVTFFVNNSAGFTAAATGLTFKGTEAWEESTLAGGNIALVSDSLVPGVANSVFTTGSLTTVGITAQSNTLGSAAATLSPRGASGLATASLGYVGTPSDQLSPNSPNDSFDLIMSSGGAVSLNPTYYDFTATGPTDKLGTVVIKVYDTSNVLLGTQTMNNVGYNEVPFLGMVATGGSQIGRINLWGLTNPTNSTAGADNISVFIPEPSSAVFVLFSGVVGLLFQKQRSKQSL